MSDTRVNTFLQMQETILRLEEKISRRKFWRRMFRLSVSAPGVIVLVLVLFSTYATKSPLKDLFTLLFVVALVGVAFALIYTVSIRMDRKDKRWEPVPELELQLTLAREKKALLAAELRPNTSLRRSAYRDRVTVDVLGFRNESARWRKTHNALQSVIIIGSLLTTTLAGVSIQNASTRWAAVVSSFAVGVAAGFAGYFKFRERSFYLQQTADSIEQEWSSLELGIGRYIKEDDEEKALKMFVEEVERLKTEQRKREQNLDQPPENDGRQSQ
uniref:SLATT domain-containing protein n=1 Tax=Paractinoplanes polyasparticus TaxID=2856853 RepID=UPI00210236EF|nr:SLATT domain-containing protein [Actinoplanes polyasparticus]